MQVIRVHRVSKNSNNLRTDSKFHYIFTEDWNKGMNGLICSYLCRHVAGILQDLSRAEIDNRLLVAARDNATTGGGGSERVHVRHCAVARLYLFTLQLWSRGK